MAINAYKYVDELVGIFLVLILFGAFFPQIQTAINDLGLGAVNLSGTVYDMAWVGYLVGLGLLIGLAFVGINQMKGSGKK